MERAHSICSMWSEYVEVQNRNLYQPVVFNEMKKVGRTSRFPISSPSYAGMAKKDSGRGCAVTGYRKASLVRGHAACCPVRQKDALGRSDIDVEPRRAFPAARRKVHPGLSWGNWVACCGSQLLVARFENLDPSDIGIIRLPRSILSIYTFRGPSTRQKLS